ncbi:MAG: hypothetical protein IT380_01160 [Myxococcales bacterium]|nr:hypothetical protein [Myxococcales bacterium]
MNSPLFRWALLGAAMGLVIAVTPGCTKKCGPDNCSGCCVSDSECTTSITTASCGASGAACSTCGEGQLCEAGACVTPMPEDAGIDAGPGRCEDDGDCLTAPGTICDVPTGSCVPRCDDDFDCLDKQNGSICDNRTGHCVLGQGCNFDSDCQSLNAEDKCYRYGQQCICDTRDKPDMSSQGTCRLRKGACEECANSRECGDDRIVFGPPEGIGAGKCAQLMGDTSGKMYCLYERVGQCACGTIDDGTGYCKPQSNSCNQVGCNVDKDCSSGSVCTVNQPDAGVASCGGICVPRCRWDFLTKLLISPGCPPGNTCWVDSANLDPTSIYYGSGRCKPPCQSDNDCKQSAANPFGGDNLKCAGEQLSGGGTSDKRCRANGDCMDNAECAELPNDQPYLGYCDRAAFTCETDCRPGNDPVTGLPFKDCREPHQCAVDGGVNICRLKSCVEQGGAGIACSQGEYCCGEDKNRDGTADPCPPPADRNAAGCYKAPVPPFCTTCMSSDECQNPNLPSWLSGSNACANGSKSPSCSPLPPRCMQIPVGMMASINVCTPSTWNDTTLDGLGRAKSDLGCPRNYNETFLLIDRAEQSDNYCETNDDCNLGTDAGLCATDPSLRLMDGGFLKACRCSASVPGTSARGQCPNDPDAGITSECKVGVSGQQLSCIETVVCTPSVSILTSPTDMYGCGLMP